jgi:DUF4097 and DUF4098 domain-containing protein YvlB
LAYSIPIDGARVVRVHSRSGKVTLWCEDRADIEVVQGPDRSSAIRVENGEVQISSTSKRLELRCPTGIDLVIGSMSGAVDVRGRAGSVNVSTASGSIEVENAASADIRSLSGHVQVRRCAGGCRMATKSGKALAGDAGSVEIATLSGSVTVTGTGQGVRVKTASGRVEVEANGPRDVEVKSMSGAVSVRLPGDVRPAVRIRTATGKEDIRVAPGTDCEVAIATITGRISVVAEE